MSFHVSSARKNLSGHKQLCNLCSGSCRHVNHACEDRHTYRHAQRHSTYFLNEKFLPLTHFLESFMTNIKSIHNSDWPHASHIHEFLTPMTKNKSMTKSNNIHEIKVVNMKENVNLQMIH